VRRKIRLFVSISLSLFFDRASSHLSEIVDRLIVANPVIMKDKKIWKDVVVNLIKTVVSSVDPDVRSGDNVDIRPYVKIKVIPGGAVSECNYVDGVVFRKNVSHKKMAVDGTKTDPKILLLAGGIEFQRTEAKLSSMDTLIEQEDKFMEILVEKIMSLKPDIILVGKAVARKAQELLCEHKVIVMQNVKQTILERVARMTGAILLPSTDSMVKQFGEECLGTCSKFWLRLVQDDPERSNEAQPSRILRTRISRASTYAYVEGCPSERGCTIVLRGGNRSFLAEIKKIIRFSILVAYHLRLEVAYYNDRFADLPVELDDEVYDDSSDIDDEVVDGEFDGSTLNDSNPALITFLEQYPEVTLRKERYFVSTSMDIDFNIPYRKELIGTSLFRSKNLTRFNIENHQSLLITSLLITENSSNSSGVSIPVQKSPADVKGIKYYTKHDVALGAFIIENCFQLGRWQNGFQRESRMLDQTLSFAHKPGRIDISVRKVEKSLPTLQISEENPANPSSMNASNSTSLGSGLLSSGSSNKDPLHLPLYISSYCRECGRIVTPQHMLSEEVWKMSFGKFLEIMFYNRSAKCTIGGCSHSLRDCHTLSFSCENYVAVFEFFPIHPYSLHYRESMVFPEDFYWKQTLTTINALPEKHSMLLEDFRLAMNVLEREVHDLLASRPEDLALAMADVQLMTNELTACSIKFYEQLVRTYESLPKRYADKETENRLRNILNDRLAKIYKPDHRPLSVSFTADLLQEALNNPSLTDRPSADISPATAVVPQHRSSVENSNIIAQQQHQHDEQDNQQDGDYHPTEYNATIATSFPMIHFRDTFLKAARWNTRIDTIYRFLESVRNMLIQQLQAKEQSAFLGEKVNPAGGGHVFSALYAEELDGEYQSQKRHLTDVVMADLGGRNPHELPTPPVATSQTPDTLSFKSPPLLPPTMIAEEGSPSVTATAMVASNKESRSSVTAAVVDGSNTPLAVVVSPTEQQQQHPLAPVHAIPAPTPTAASAGLYRTATTMEQPPKKTNERPVDKMGRITKALSRFLAGNKDSVEEQNKFFVPLGEFGTGRYGMKPGRFGVVIPVSEEVPASIIAYTLASEEYYDELQFSIREDNPDRVYDEKDLDNDGVGGGAGGGRQNRDDNDDRNNDPLPTIPENRGRAKTLQGQQFDTGNDSSLSSISVAASSSSSTFLSPFGKRNKDKDNSLPAVQEGDEDDDDIDQSTKSGSSRLLGHHHHHHHNQNNPKAGTNYGLTSLMKNFSNEDLASGNENLSGFSSSNNLFAGGNNNNSNILEETDGDGSNVNSPEGAQAASALSSNILVDTVKAGVNTVTNINTNIQEGVKKLIFSSEVSNASNPASNSPVPPAMMPHSSSSGNLSSFNQTNEKKQVLPESTTAPSSNSAADNASANEKQMTSQDKSIIRHRFDDYDDRGNLISKFHCQVYYAKQFEALRSCYFKEEESRENFIRSLATSSRWSAQGGKSGASFAKTMDDRLVVKQIQRVELQMFLDFAPAYFGKEKPCFHFLFLFPFFNFSFSHFLFLQFHRIHGQSLLS
jgi:hypothetical protein